MSMTATRTEAEAVADALCALLTARLVPASSAADACRVAGITLADLNDARIRQENGRARPARRVEAWGNVEPEKESELDRERRIRRERWNSSTLKVKPNLTSRSVSREMSELLFESSDSTIQSVIDTAAELFGVAPSRITGRSQAGRLQRIRSVTMAAARFASGESYPVIGVAFDRDHTTVLHSCKKVLADEKLCRTAELLVKEVERKKTASCSIGAQAGASIIPLPLTERGS